MSCAGWAYAYGMPWNAELQPHSGAAGSSDELEHCSCAAAAAADKPQRHHHVRPQVCTHVLLCFILYGYRPLFIK
jgi:hypothetical protein